MPFINLTNSDGLSITLNIDHVVYAEPNGSRAKVNLVTGGHLRVQESFEDVQALLPGYIAPLVVKEAAVDVAANPSKEAATSGAAADAANPAKSRQIK